jgi:hypothetical protein
MTATEYLRRKQNELYTTRIIKNGQMFAVVNGEEIPESEFRKSVKVPDRLWAGKENPNKKSMAIA